MATHHEVSTKGDDNTLLSALAAGLGSPMSYGFKTATLAKTCANGYQPSFAMLRGKLGEPLAKGRCDRPSYTSEATIHVARPTFDMLGRASAYTHGIPASQDYPVPTRGKDTSNGNQCQTEAAHAIQCLEGLNLVADDVVTAALLGASARNAVVPGKLYDEGKSLQALARIAVRMLGDGVDSRLALTERIGKFVTALEADVADVGRR